MERSKTILIADDDKDLRFLLSTRCEDLGLNVITVADAMTAIKTIDAIHPDIVCLDVNLPAGSGLSVAEMLTNNEVLGQTPIIIMTGDKDHDIEKTCDRLAVYYVPKCDNTWERLQPLLGELLDSGSEQVGLSTSSQCSTKSDSIDQLFSSLGWEATLTSLPQEKAVGIQTHGDQSPWILSIDDDSDLSFSMRVRLAEYGITLKRAFEGMDGFRLAFASPPQAIVLDYEMPDVNGDYVLRRLKDNPVTKNIPVIVLTGHRDNNLKRTMLNLGATSFLTKPVRWDDLWRELREHVTTDGATAKLSC